MRKKSEIKPIHLVLAGVTVIILGVLIPSLFISAFSTIGFSLIIGLLILTAAYVFFGVNTVKSRGRKTIKWLMIPVILLLLVVAGLYSNHAYQQNLNDKIYSINDKISFPDFGLEIDKPLFSTVEFSVPKEKVTKFGGLGITEDCSRYPYLSWQTNGVNILSFDYNENTYEKEHPSGRYCEWRNDSRKEINDYISKNDRLTLSYKINAKTNVDSTKIDISLMPDSGRILKESDKLFEYDPLLSEKYTPAFDYTYKPYSSTKLGESINKDITRKGELRADIRKAETTVDFKVIYHKDGGDITRIVRVSR